MRVRVRRREEGWGWGGRLLFFLGGERGVGVRKVRKERKEERKRTDLNVESHSENLIVSSEVELSASSSSV